MSRMKFLMLLCLVLLVLSCPKGEQTAPDKEETVYTGKAQPRWVNATVGLRIRDNANLDSNVIGAIPYGEKVILLHEQDKEEEIDGIMGRWSRIRWQDKEGWVFGGFLQKDEIVRPNAEKPQVQLSGRYDLVEDEYRSQYIDFKNNNTCIFIFNFCQGFGEVAGTYKVEDEIVSINITDDVVLKCKILSPYELEIVENAELFTCYNLQNGTRLVKNTHKGGGIQGIFT
jgi:hypothetical protein